MFNIYDISSLCTTITRHHLLFGHKRIICAIPIPVEFIQCQDTGLCQSYEKNIVFFQNQWKGVDIKQTLCNYPFYTHHKYNLAVNPFLGVK